MGTNVFPTATLLAWADIADNAAGAGDVANFAELSVAEQPTRIAVERVYEQPSLQARPVSGASPLRGRRERGLSPCSPRV